MLEQMVLEWSNGNNEEGVTLIKPGTNMKFKGNQQSKAVDFFHPWVRISFLFPARRLLIGSMTCLRGR